MRRLALAALVFVASGCSPFTDAADPLSLRPTTQSPSASAAPSPSPSPTPSPASSEDLTARAMNHVQELVKIGPRVKGKEGELQAADYIEAKLREAGLEVVRQTFQLAIGRQAHNIIARLPGVDYAKGYVLLGAHYDTVPKTPGGNDNASGTAMVIALAETEHAYLAYKGTPVEFVLFAAEEIDQATKQHHEGSRHYRDNADLTGIKAMLSIDMIGNGDKVLVVSDRRAPGSLGPEVIDAASRAGVAVEAKEAGDVSDHTSFSRRGVDAVLLWAGKHPSFHQPSDDLSVVQTEAMERCARLIMEWLKTR